MSAQRDGLTTDPESDTDPPFLPCILSGGHLWRDAVGGECILKGCGLNHDAPAAEDPMTQLEIDAAKADLARRIEERMAASLSRLETGHGMVECVTWEMALAIVREEADR